MNNELSRIHSLLDSDGTTHLADYTYLGRDRTVQVDFPQPGAKFTYIKQGSEGNGDGGDQYTGWDRFGRAIDLRWIKNSSGAELERLKHGYDRASNRLYRKNVVAGASNRQDELYAYDGLSQLSDFQRGELNGTDNGIVSGTLAAREQFAFDPTGNWNSYVVNAGTPQTRTHNKANELLTIDGTSSPVGEDAAGNMTKVPKPDNWVSPYDLKYDAWNRLVEVKDGSTVVATYAYDGLNRRVTKTVGSTPRHFYYTDKWQIIEERLHTNTYADRQFVWGIRYTDDLVLRDKGSERLYVIQDYFQPTAVMDTSGVVLERYGYGAFGTSRVMTASYVACDPSSYEWETRFGAYRWDGETKMLQVRNRYLHTQLGRWVTRDPVEYEDGPNLYAYVDNAPISFVDPAGLAGKGLPPTIPTKTPISGCPAACAAALTYINSNYKGYDLAGSSVCDDNGTKCACSLGFVISPGVRYKPGDCPDLDNLIIDHETRHFPQVRCSAQKQYCFTEYLPEFDNKEAIDKIECSFVTEDLVGLDALILKTPASDPCYKAIHSLLIRKRDLKDSCDKRGISV